MSGKKRVRRHPLHFAAEIVRGGRLLDEALRKPDRKIYWAYGFEWKWQRERWGDVTAQSDFPEKFVRLTSGLDAESCKTVIRIIKRTEQIVNAKKPLLDFFTSEEQEELRRLRDNFHSEILQVSDGLFAWRNYLLPTSHFEASVFWCRHGLSTLKTLDTVKGKTIIDAGGYVGDSVLIFQELEASAIYTFEPVPENFARLKRTLELNHIANAVPENIALGAESGAATMSVAGSGSSIKKEDAARQGERVTVPMRALDDYARERSLQVGLIKTDLEGAEMDFLAGAKRTICGQKPILLISIYHTARDFFEIKPLIESWNLGYRFSVYHPTIGSASLETLLIGEVSG